jgi:hypothetical protein
MTERERAEQLACWQAAVEAVARNKQAVSCANFGMDGAARYPKGQESRVAEEVARLVVKEIAGAAPLRSH